MSCDCPEDVCARFCEPASDCIERLEGAIELLYCRACETKCWHQDRACLRCIKYGRWSRPVLLATS